MGITTDKYIRKPLYVDAVRITGANFDEIAAWCQGEVQQDETSGKTPGKKYIKVRVHNPKNPRQTKAYVGDWLLYTERGYKVYTNKAFHASFDPVSYSDVDESGVKDTLVVGEEEVAPGVTANQVVGKIKGEAVFSQGGGGAIDLADDVASEQPRNVDTAPEQEKIEPAAAEGKRVLSIAEQEKMSADDIRELIQSGEAVLAQDIEKAA